MADPSKERIAAALALAEAVCALATAVDGDGAVPPELLQARQDALRAYRATAPKLRTRAEVDAEIVSCLRSAYASGSLVGSLVEIGELCREETAPKLRTRAEVDAEIVAQVRDYFGGGPKSSGALGEQYALIQELCREETAPAAAGNYVPLCEIDLNEETRGVPAKIGGPLPRCSSCGSEPGPSVELTFQWRGNREWYCTRGGCREPSALTDHDADTRELQDPEPCGCQLAERVARLERATEMAPYAARIRALREIRDDLEGE